MKLVLALVVATARATEVRDAVHRADSAARDARRLPRRLPSEWVADDDETIKVCAENVTTTCYSSGLGDDDVLNAYVGRAEILPVGPDFATYFKENDARSPTLQT